MKKEKVSSFNGIDDMDVSNATGKTPSAGENLAIALTAVLMALVLTNFILGTTK